MHQSAATNYYCQANARTTLEIRVRIRDVDRCEYRSVKSKRTKSDEVADNYFDKCFEKPSTRKTDTGRVLQCMTSMRIQQLQSPRGSIHYADGDTSL